MTADYLESARTQFHHYKAIGERTFAQIPDDALFWQYNETSNSVAIIVKHMWGNMLSRWTDFLTTDGEKEWRQRDAEFDADIATKKEMLEKWEAGWACLFEALNTISEDDFTSKKITIRSEELSIVSAINRQLAHYAYHVGQIVFVGKMVSEDWSALSIPKGDSNAYNAAMFSKPKQ